MLNAVSPVDVHISYNHTGEFKTKNGEKNTNANQKKAKGLSAPQCVQALGVGMARDRSQRKIKTAFRQGQGHYTMINRSTHEKDKGFLNAFVPKTRTAKQIIVGDFDTILTKHGRIPP